MLDLCFRDLEDEVVKLILTKKISARIDSEKQILHTRVDNAHQMTFTKATSLTKKFLQENKALLVRLSLIKHDLIQKSVATGERRSKKSLTMDLSSDILL